MKIIDLKITIHAECDEDLYDYILLKAVSKVGNIPIDTLTPESASEIVQNEPNTKYEDQMNTILKRIVHKHLNKSKLHKFLGRTGAKLSEEQYDIGMGSQWLPTADLTFESHNINVKGGETEQDASRMPKVEKDNIETTPRKYASDWESGKSSYSNKRAPREGAYKEIVDTI